MNKKPHRVYYQHHERRKGHQEAEMEEFFSDDDEDEEEEKDEEEEEEDLYPDLNPFDVLATIPRGEGQENEQEAAEEEEEEEEEEEKLALPTNVMLQPPLLNSTAPIPVPAGQVPLPLEQEHLEAAPSSPWEEVEEEGASASLVPATSQVAVTGDAAVDLGQRKGKIASDHTRSTSNFSQMGCADGEAPPESDEEILAGGTGKTDQGEEHTKEDDITRLTALLSYC